ncbi:phosphomannomutase/phosphoglucomutase [Zhongshania antarctica]|uniref:phosphomannomutase n=1 Tax=Zhongshania antarctica TaxID=641702 RepID=A0A840R0P5_9GAMM|nr:phosphomannomutase/phosphoglucomutase [Zhongshania antarctica]MBB5186669.1 phosphomannomutase/phosphoglucomutase [Zhongshania antarctica]
MSKKASTTIPEKQKKASRFSILQRDIVISAVLSICGIVAAFYWIQNIEEPRALTQRMNTVTANSADHQRVIIREAIAQLSARLKQQADNPELSKILRTSDLAARSVFEQSLERAFPEAIDAKVIIIGPQGIADERSETARLRNNIEIDMLRKSLGEGGIVIEAYSHKNAWFISFVTKVDKHGALVITFSAQYFEQMLKSLAGNAVTNELIQTYKTRRDTVIRPANTDYAEAMQSRVLSVPGWTLQVYPQPQTVQNLRSDGTLLWLVCMFCVATIAASHAIFFVRGFGIARPASAPPKKAVLDKAETDILDLEQALAKKLAANRSRTPSHRDNFPAPDSSPPLPELQQGARTRRGPLAINCFRAYDIRGVADTELNNETCEAIGRAVASEALSRGQSKLLLGRDGRLSSPRIHEALVKGVLGSGVDVIDLGLLATPMLHYACQYFNIGNAIMITGSHNPGHYNGMKISLEFQSLSGQDIQNLRKRIEDQDFEQGQGSLTNDSIEQRYIDRICGDVVIAQTLKVVIDAGNGATAHVAPALFEELGCEVIPLFCETDGNFPNHAPDPTIFENLAALRTAVADNHADIGIAFDGDGDRVAVVTARGKCPKADQLMMVLAQDMVVRNPGAEILFDIKCSRLLPELIIEHGGRPTMWKCGHSYMKRKMAETGALLGGEFSGHIFFKERWYGFDDGMYTAARLLEILTLSGRTMDDALSNQGALLSSPEIIIPVDEDRKFAIVETFAENQDFAEATLSEIDGLRVDFRHGWGLIRASNTGPAITLRFEADSEAALSRIQNDFKDLLARIDPKLADSL